MDFAGRPSGYQAPTLHGGYSSAPKLLISLNRVPNARWLCRSMACKSRPAASTAACRSSSAQRMRRPNVADRRLQAARRQDRACDDRSGSGAAYDRGEELGVSSSSPLKRVQLRRQYWPHLIAINETGPAMCLETTSVSPPWLWHLPLDRTESGGW